MSDLNVWTGSGRITRDTELKFTPSGSPVAEISLCCNRSWSKDGERQEEPVFVDVTLWGKQAEVLAQYLGKGTFVTVRGRLHLDTWQAEDGARRSKLKVIAEQVNLGPKASGKSKGSGSERRESSEVEEDAPF